MRVFYKELKPQTGGMLSSFELHGAPCSLFPFLAGRIPRGVRVVCPPLQMQAADRDEPLAITNRVFVRKV